MPRREPIEAVLTQSGMLSARAIASAIATGFLDQDQILDHVETVIGMHEPDIRAFESIDLDNARLMSRGATGPLRAIPFAVKDNFDTIEFPTRHGSAIYAEASTAGHDASSIAMTRRMGATLIGKTTLPEFAMFDAPATRNPRWRERTPGGSSSGSAAAVAAGMVAFAFGSQTAGSVIRPAAFCGVAALKPSKACFPDAGIKPLASSLDSVGLLAATVDDLAFIMESFGVGGRGDAHNRILPWRIAFCGQWGDVRASDQAVAVLDQVMPMLLSAGMQVSMIELPAIVAAADRAHGVIMAFEAAQALSFEMQNHQPQLSQRLRDYLNAAITIEKADYHRARAIARTAATAVLDLWDDYDAVATPSAIDVPPLGLSDTGSAAFNRLWTLLDLPVINVPGFLTTQGLPIGLQLVGPHGEEGHLLAVAADIEAHCSGIKPGAFRRKTE